MPEQRPMNLESLAQLFKKQAETTRALYHQRQVLQRAPVELFTATEAETLRTQYEEARAVLRKIANRLELATGRAMPPLELFYT